tara:strand:- start:158 stop:781 length:624 start_codon:yes stop_codon:yes gene_type:complete
LQLKKNKISKNWLVKKHRDLYFKQAKLQGFRSRSAFKLIEMNEKFKFLRNNISLLDLGSSPGGWSQVAEKKIKKGRILAVDIKDMENIDGVDFIKGDFSERETCDKIINYFNNGIDVLISDMAKNTSGNKNLDSFNTGQLCLEAMKIAKKTLKNDGVFISKLFMGSIFNEIHQEAKKCFQKIIKYKPLSSKKESKEIYIYCKGILKI